jgi:hypothetical protein
MTSAAGPAIPAPPLPVPAGAVIRVATEPEPQAAVSRLTSGTTIVMAPGIYRLTKTLSLHDLGDVALRGDTDDPDAVVLEGPGMNNADYGAAPYGIWAGNGVDGLLIANLSIRGFYFHPIIFNAGVARPHVYNLHLVDAGQQFIKSNPDDLGKGNDSGIVEYTVFEFTATSRDGYSKAIDIHGATGWIIRHNLFRNIRAPEGILNGPAVLAWRGSRDTVVDANTFINCQREIVIGAETVTPNSHEGGRVSNNFIYRDAGLFGDAAVSVWDSPDTRVVHNTILLSRTYPTAIEYRFPDTTGVIVANNLTDTAIIAREGASAVVEGNVTTATPALFVDAVAGDLHLQPAALSLLPAGVNLDMDAQATDWDGDPRPAASPDIGADQRRLVTTAVNQPGARVRSIRRNGR